MKTVQREVRSSDLHSNTSISIFSLDPTAGYVSHAVNLICEKGTNDSQLFLAALDTLISIVTDPICQIRKRYSMFI